MRVLFGDHEIWPVKTIPFAINKVQHPLPSAKRCYKLGQALQKAIESYPEDLNVVIASMGGMFHQLQGERAGIMDVEYDLPCMDSIINKPSWFYGQMNGEIIEKAGTEGIETIMWLTMRGEMGDKVNCLHKHYHAPISSNGAGVLLHTSEDE